MSAQAELACPPVGNFIPESFVVPSHDMPFAEDFGAPGVRLQLLVANIEAGFFAVRIRFAPGIQLPPHKHTGVVHAFTISGEWSYLEYADAPPSTAGAYLFEPAGSTHTLKVADHNQDETEVFFIIYGAMLVLDEEGKVACVLDAGSHIEDFAKAMRQQGVEAPVQVIGGGSTHYLAL